LYLDYDKSFDYDWGVGNVNQAHHLTIREDIDTGMIVHRGNKKVSDYETIPLRYIYHQGKEGIHTLGRKKWEAYHSQPSKPVNQEILYYIFCKLNNLNYLPR